MSDLEVELKNEEKNIKEKKSKISLIEKEFTSIFSCENNDKQIIPSAKARKNGTIQIYYHEYINNIPVQSSLFFTLSVKNDALDFVSNISFFSNNTNSHKISDVVNFNNVLNPVLSKFETLDQPKLIDLIKELKESLKSIESSEKLVSNLKSEILFEESKKELNQVFKVLNPVGNFCLDTFLTNYLKIPFEGDKPNRKTIAEVNEAIIEKIQETRTGRVYGSNPFKFNFTYFEVIDGKIKFHSNELEVNYNGKTLYYNLGYKKLSKKKVNEMLSNRFTYKGEKVTNLRAVGLKEYTNYTAKEVKDIFSKDIMQNNVNEF